MQTWLVVLAVSGVVLEGASAFLTSPVGIQLRSRRTCSPLRAGMSVRILLNRRGLSWPSFNSCALFLAGSVSVSVQPRRRLWRNAVVSTNMAEDLSGSFGLGFDFGTSGARINVVDADSLEVVHEGACSYSEQTAAVWVAAMEELLLGIPAATRRKVTRIAVNTSHLK